MREPCKDCGKVHTFEKDIAELMEECMQEMAKPIIEKWTKIAAVSIKIRDIKEGTDAYDRISTAARNLAEKEIRLPLEFMEVLNSLQEKHPH